jgi:hypothetical protein
MKDECLAHWKTDYLRFLQTQTPVKHLTFLDTFLHRKPMGTELSEFEHYLLQTPVMCESSSDFSPIQWWWEHRGEYPTLYQDTLDTLAIPAMSAECERVFSSAKKMLTPERNGLQEDVLEAAECLRAWWKESLIGQI